MDYSKILIKPVITEKSTDLKEINNKVAFIVADNANKIQVKRAVQEAFEVEPVSVNILQKRARLKKRFGRKIGKKRGFKKAYITLPPGEHIEFFKGV